MPSPNSSPPPPGPDVAGPVTSCVSPTDPCERLPSRATINDDITQQNVKGNPPGTLPRHDRVNGYTRLFPKPRRLTNTFSKKTRAQEEDTRPVRTHRPTEPHEAITPHPPDVSHCPQSTDDQTDARFTRLVSGEIKHGLTKTTLAIHFCKCTYTITSCK